MSYPYQLPWWMRRRDQVRVERIIAAEALAEALFGWLRKAE